MATPKSRLSRRPARLLPLREKSLRPTAQKNTTGKCAGREVLEAKIAAEKRLQDTISQFAHIIHEIRNPLNGIIPLIELLRTEGYKHERTEFLELMEVSLRTALATVNNALDMARIDAGMVDIRPGAFSPARVLEEVVQSQTGALLAKDITLITKIDRSIPEWLEGDPFRLKQVLLNLVGNAVKFTSDGGITVQVTVHDSSSSRITLRFSIRDTGIGLTPETLRGMFEPFSQAAPFPAESYGGSGLGLSISRKLAQLMGGRVWGESTPGQGSTFHLQLPFYIVAAHQYDI